MTSFYHNKTPNFQIINLLNCSLLNLGMYCLNLSLLNGNYFWHHSEAILFVILTFVVIFKSVSKGATQSLKMRNLMKWVQKCVTYTTLCYENKKKVHRGTFRDLWDCSFAKFVHWGHVCVNFAKYPYPAKLFESVLFYYWR